MVLCGFQCLQRGCKAEMGVWETKVKTDGAVSAAPSLAVRC